MDREPTALLLDITRCIGCRACVAACKEEHGIAGDDSDTVLSSRALTALADGGDGRYVRKLCMHCVSPSCASVCPVAALRKTEAGPVIYEASRCMGCRYCMLACPFGVPRYEWDAAIPSVRKCDLCAPRLARGETTACAAACPAGATVAGPRAAMIEEAHRRIAENPGTYVPRVYGEAEVGGTSVLFLSPVPFEALGFPASLEGVVPPELTGRALERIPGIILLGGSALMAIAWITRRRQEVALAESPQGAER
jgi:formate dehydrogenase iron-sulfur subunit